MMFQKNTKFIKDIHILFKINSCLEELIKRDAPGYAIGGLAGGEDK